jgi:hypothetical protein
MSKIQLSKTEKNGLVVQGNGFLDGWYAPETKTLHRHLFIEALSRIPSDAKKIPPITFSVSDLFGKRPHEISGWEYSQLRVLVKNHSIVKILNTEKIYAAWQIVTSVIWDHKKDTLTVQFNNENGVRDELIQLAERGRFTIYLKRDYRALSSRYAKDLFEILCQWLNSNKSHVFEVDDLVARMGVTNSAAISSFNKFNAYILAPAVAEINEKTSLKVRYEKGPQESVWDKKLKANKRRTRTVRVFRIHGGDIQPTPSDESEPKIPRV